jgi:hypothetical protein
MAQALAALDAQTHTIDRLFNVAGLARVPRQARYAAALAMLLAPVVAVLALVALGEDATPPAAGQASKDKPTSANKKAKE